jgi:hypothetical protein
MFEAADAERCGADECPADEAVPGLEVRECIVGREVTRGAPNGFDLNVVFQ